MSYDPIGFYDPAGNYDILASAPATGTPVRVVVVVQPFNQVVASLLGTNQVKVNDPGTRTAVSSTSGITNVKVG